MPTGIQAPLVVSYDASSIPVLQLSLDSDNLNEQQLYDYGYYNLRQRLAPVQGVTFPTPDGGKYREIVVDVDPHVARRIRCPPVLSFFVIGSTGV
jgi:multidrug efflux pump subunit AcrB